MDRITRLASKLAHAASAMRSFVVPEIKTIRDPQYGGTKKIMVQRTVFRRRLRPAIRGGNWQGRQYLTYAEHDQIKQNVMALRTYADKLKTDKLTSNELYAEEKAAFLKHRKEKYGV